MDPENEKNRRDYAERIIAGEYKCAVVTMIDNEGDFRVWFDGGRAECNGLADIAHQAILQSAVKGYFDEE